MRGATVCRRRTAGELEARRRHEHAVSLSSPIERRDAEEERARAFQTASAASSSSSAATPSTFARSAAESGVERSRSCSACMSKERSQQVRTRERAERVRRGRTCRSFLRRARARRSLSSGVGVASSSTTGARDPPGVSRASCAPRAPSASPAGSSPSPSSDDASQLSRGSSLSAGARATAAAGTSGSLALPSNTPAAATRCGRSSTAADVFQLATAAALGGVGAPCGRPLPARTPGRVVGCPSAARTEAARPGTARGRGEGAESREAGGR